MRIIKCDICEKIIEDAQKSVHIGMGYVSMEICLDCGESAVKLMRENGVIDENNERIRK